MNQDEIEDQPIFTLANVFEFIITFLAAFGMVSVCGMIGLYYGGFFHWVASKNPDSIFSALMGLIA